MSDKPIDQLLDIMRRLRAPDGCPWDQEQTLDSLKKYLIEEAYEVIDAIEHGEVADHADELGDLLLHVVFQAQIRSEEGAFNFDDVAQCIVDKMIRRHPHVFGDATADTSEDVLRNWEAIKAEERKGKEPKEPSVLDNVPVSLPALMRAAKLQKRAARIGFDWDDTAGVLEKLAEETQEVKEALASGDEAALDEELGDLLFSVVNLCRFKDREPEELMRQANQKFENRFRAMEKFLAGDGKDPATMSLEELDRYWEQAKSSLAAR